MTDKDLIAKAREARAKSYAPYSNFHVGAALLGTDGSVTLGCNIENAAFGAGTCAERTALYKAVSEGIRSFEAIAIVGQKEGGPEEYCPPCGICRQALSEFCEPGLRVLMCDGSESIRRTTLGDLLPLSFRLD